MPKVAVDLLRAAKGSGSCWVVIRRVDFTPAATQTRSVLPLRGRNSAEQYLRHPRRAIEVTTKTVLAARSFANKTNNYIALFSLF
jgi:hypothetical protein